MSTVAEQIAGYGVVPVVVLEDAKDAAPLAKALVEGGLPVQRLLSVQQQQRNVSVLWPKNIRICL